QSVSIICYNLHLESRSNDELRLAQLNELLQDAGGCDSTQPIVVAGDLNLNASKPAIADLLARAGFRDVVPSSRVPTTPARHLLEAGRYIDWAFVRGPAQADGGKVHRSVRGSDHYPISFELRSQSGRTSQPKEEEHESEINTHNHHHDRHSNHCLGAGQIRRRLCSEKYSGRCGLSIAAAGQ